MSDYTVTIRTFLLSHMTNDFGEKNGSGLENFDFNGDYYHPNKIIEKTCDKIFENMILSITPSATFKRDFCKRFYNREIGFSTMSQFLIALENELNTSCYNLLRFIEEIRNMDTDEGLMTINMNNEGKSENEGNSQNLQIASSEPGTDLEIIYTPGEGAIRYANSLGEAHSKQSANAITKTNTKGSSTGPKFQMLNMFAQIKDIEFQIFNILESLFMQIW